MTVATPRKDLAALLPTVVRLVQRTGQMLLPYFDRVATLTVYKKADRSPYTEADLAAHTELAAGLMDIDPDIPVISEEGEHPTFLERQSWPSVWLVDPLDGTRGFIRGVPEFTINVALIEAGVPILGVLCAPKLGQCYYAAAGLGAFVEESGIEIESNLQRSTVTRLSTAQHRSTQPLRALVGHYRPQGRLNQVLESLPSVPTQVNSALKFGYIARGDADCYLRFGPIYEWDTAAGQCILTEAGGGVFDLQGNSLRYNRRAALLVPKFIALGDLSLLSRLLNVVNTLSLNR